MGEIVCGTPTTPFIADIAVVVCVVVVVVVVEFSLGGGGGGRCEAKEEGGGIGGKVLGKSGRGPGGGFSIFGFIELFFVMFFF